MTADNTSNLPEETPGLLAIQPSETITSPTATIPVTPSATAPIATSTQTSTLEPTATPTQTPTLEPTITPTQTPDIVATNRASFIILNATPIYENVNDFQFSLKPTEDLQSMILTVERPDGQSHTVSLKSLLTARLGYAAISSVILLTLEDIDSNGEIEAVFDTDTYGSHCCNHIFVVYYDSETETYVSSSIITQYWRNYLEMIDLEEDGHPEFVTTNTVFYAIQPNCCGAEQFSPIQIFRFDMNQLNDVTTDYPDLLEADAAFWWAILSHENRTLPPNYTSLTGNNEDAIQYWITEGSIWGVHHHVVSAFMANMVRLDRSEEACQMLADFFDLDKEPNPREPFSHTVFSSYEGTESCQKYTAQISTWLEESKNLP
ncbi:MAG: hypothetical protein AAF490_27250 [Chloroflexota bacterium]